MIMLKKLLISICIIFCCANLHCVFSQNKSDVPHFGFNCEYLNVRFESLRRMYVGIENDEKPFLPLIMIARLGEKETNNNLNWQRLRVFEEFANMSSLLDVVTAQGKKAKGLGRVEFYYGGVLRFVIVAERNKKFKTNCFTEPV